MRLATFRSAVLGALVSIALTFATTASAGTVYYWYSGGSAGTQGGSGTWDLTSYCWSSSTDTADGNLWPNTTDYDAEFGGTAGNVSLGGAVITAGGLTLDASGYVLSTGTLNLGGDGITTTYGSGGGTISAAVHLQTSQTWTIGVGGALTISGIISGSGVDFTKAYSGTLILSQANTFTGTTTIAAGTLSQGVDDAISNCDLIVSGGGVFTMNGHNNSSMGAVTLTSGTICGGSGGTATGGTLMSSSDFIVTEGMISAVLDGDVGLTKTGAATNVVLVADNMYSGTTNIYGGTLTLGNKASTFTGWVAGDVYTGDSTNGTGTLRFFRYASGHTDSFDHVISGDGAVTQAAGTLSLTQKNTYTGMTTEDGSTLILGVDNAIGANGVGGLTVSGNGVFNMNAHTATVGPVTLTYGSITGAAFGTHGSVSGGTLYSTVGFTVTRGLISTALAGPVSLTKDTAAQQVILDADCIYTGTTYIYGGTLTLGNHAQPVAGWISTDVYTGDSTHGTGTLNFYRYQSGNTDTFSHVISGDGAVWQSQGTLVLAAQNTNTGRTTVTGSTLHLGIDDAICGPLFVGAGNPIFRTMGHTATISGCTITTGSITGNIPATGPAGLLYSTSGFVASGGSINGVVLAGPGGLYVNVNNQTVALYSACTYAGDTIIAGGATAASCLRIGVNNAIGGGNLYINWGTLDMASCSDTLSAVSMGTWNSSAGTGTSGTISWRGTQGSLTSTGGFTVYSGSITAILAGNVGLTKTGGPATYVQLTAANAYTGATHVNSGILRLGATGSIAASSEINVNATLDVSAYTSGWLLGSSQTLSGGGTVTGTVLASGAVSPGNSPGTLTVTNATFQNLSNLLIELASQTSYDKLVTGALTIQPGSTLTVTLLDGYMPTTFTTFDILDFTSEGGTFDTLNLPALGGQRTWDTSKLYTTGEIKVVPEPGTLALLAAGLIGLLAYAWRRRK
jgi:autotransporter-associated beta strand protein